MKRLFVISILTLLAFSCRDFTGPELPENLLGVEWDMLEFQQPDGNGHPVGATRVTLIFREDSMLVGRGYTVLEGWEDWDGFEYRTHYEIGPNGELSAGRPFTRYSGLPGFPHPSRWEEYVRAISLAESYSVVADELFIHYDGGWALYLRKLPIQ